ncbi:MAG: MotA/TolQ/ExbB proton channel family protein [Planctomycetota bacterium]|nr:MotA/TolQ/ExbB proton channel family protein [Planctomycetota bacterium]
MNCFKYLYGVALLATPGFAQEQAPTAAPHESVTKIAASAGLELQKSTAELNALREQIANDKLPLAQEITALEELLTQVRRENDQVTRQVDEGKLDITNAKAIMKARVDELTYVGNFLDEYSRTLETKLHVSELQLYGDALTAAKQATENKTLTMGERFERQLAFVELSTKRLFDSIGGVRFPGTGVDQQGAVIEGQFALLGPIALFAAKVGGVAGVVIPQTGSLNPLIKPLEGAFQIGLSSLVLTGEGSAPLDPSRGGALKALVQRTNIIHIFEKGGPIMWPLLVASILALTTVIERLIFLASEKRRRDPNQLENFFATVKRGDLDAAVHQGGTSKFFVVRALTYALGHRESSLGNALDYAKANEMKRFTRGIPVLDTVITLAPLLGLLGTVTGMMGSFSIIGGDLSSPGAITGGIAEALIATAFGLGIAITCLLPFNFLNARLDEAQHELDSAASQLEMMLQTQPTPTSGTTPAAPHPTPAAQHRHEYAKT